jgi:hypothetical protein
MSSRRLTLMTDGPFDQVLLRHISWLLRRQLPEDTVVQLQWADLRGLPVAPKGLAERIGRALDLFPCDLLVVHRDSETPSPDPRFDEVINALIEARCNVNAIIVVPVRMTEAWLLFNQQAIRLAAGNPNGSSPLRIPATRWDELPDPKNVLYEALRVASEFTGRRLRKFQVAQAAHRVSEYIDDFSPLLSLQAFARFEADLTRILSELNW